MTSIINYLYYLIWGEIEDEEDNTKPVIDYQKIIDLYRKEQDEIRRNELVTYYKYGYF